MEHKLNSYYVTYRVKLCHRFLQNIADHQFTRYTYQKPSLDHGEWTAIKIYKVQKLHNLRHICIYSMYCLQI